MLAAAVAFGGVVGLAQEETGRPAPSNIQGGAFPRINADGTVTFRVRADEAGTVSIHLPDFGTIALARGDDGFWWGTSAGGSFSASPVAADRRSTSRARTAT
jgi:hypothetical protein